MLQSAQVPRISLYIPYIFVFFIRALSLVNTTDLSFNEKNYSIPFLVYKNGCISQITKQ